jgi:hypothetical protein
MHRFMTIMTTHPTFATFHITSYDRVRSSTWTSHVDSASALLVEREQATEFVDKGIKNLQKLFKNVVDCAQTLSRAERAFADGLMAFRFDERQVCICLGRHPSSSSSSVFVRVSSENPHSQRDSNPARARCPSPKSSCLCSALAKRSRRLRKTVIASTPRFSPPDGASPDARVLMCCAGWALQAQALLIEPLKQFRDKEIADSREKRKRYDREADRYHQMLDKASSQSAKKRDAGDTDGQVVSTRLEVCTRSRVLWS